MTPYAQMTIDEREPDTRVTALERVRRRLDRGIAWVLVALVGFAVVNVLWQVFTRWVLDDPSTYTEELARFLLIWIGLLGAAYAVSKKLHLAIDLLPRALKGRRQHVLQVVIEGIVFVFALAVMVVGGTRLVLLMLEFGQLSAALGIPLGYVYLIIPLSGALIMFYTVVTITEHVRALSGEPVAIEEEKRSTTLPID